MRIRAGKMTRRRHNNRAHAVYGDAALLRDELEPEMCERLIKRWLPAWLYRKVVNLRKQRQSK